MTETERYYFLIPDAGSAGLLLDDTPDGPSLPWVEQPDDAPAGPAALLDKIAKRHHLRVTRLQTLRRWTTGEAGATTTCFVWLLERHDDGAASGLRPYTLDEALDRIADAELSAALQRWDALRTATPDSKAEPWARPGWYDEAVGWMRDALAEHGLHLQGDVRQVKMWPLSCVLGGETEAGRVFLKAVPPLFGAEPGITAMLAQRYPAHVPPVIATDTARGWTLMRDHGAQELRERTEPAVWQAALRRYGEIQQEMSAFPNAVLAAGSADRRKGARQADTHALADACRALLPPERYAERCDQIDGLAAELEADEDALLALGIAPSLVHGDFHLGNIGLAGDRVIYFDWTDAALAHPFIDFYTFLTEAVQDAATVTQSTEAETRLTDAYLSAFRPQHDAATLERALALIRPLGALYMVTSYVNIVQALAPEDRFEMTGALAFWVRTLLAEKGA